MRSLCAPYSETRPRRCMLRQELRRTAPVRAASRAGEENRPRQAGKQPGKVTAEKLQQSGPCPFFRFELRSRAVHGALAGAPKQRPTGAPARTASAKVATACASSSSNRVGSLQEKRGGVDCQSCAFGTWRARPAHV